MPLLQDCLDLVLIASAAQVLEVLGLRALDRSDDEVRLREFFARREHRSVRARGRHGIFIRHQERTAESMSGLSVRWFQVVWP